MIWADFCDNYLGWSDSTLRSRISSLVDIGRGDEVVDVVIDLPTEDLKAQLIRKAIRLDVEFTHDDFMNLDGKLPDAVYQEVAAYAGFDANDPYFDEDDFTWDDFYSEYYGWSEEVTLRRIEKLDSFGPSEEVCEVICGMSDFDCQEALYEKAVSFGVKFTDEELEEMGQSEMEDVKAVLDDLFTEEDVVNLEADVNLLCENLDRIFPTAQPKPQKKGPAILGTLIGVIGALAGTGKDEHDSRYCDGDCANCPPHYGYRYGRWYYGHGHQYSCQRGGNGGRTGVTYRD